MFKKRKLIKEKIKNRLDMIKNIKFDDKIKVDKIKCDNIKVVNPS
jgi:hemerythrin superfamily protein